MRIDFPTPDQLPHLRRLWAEVFGDSEAFLDSFFSTAFSPSRCRSVTMDGELAAVLYWLDMTCRGQRIAYLYAVATRADLRGRGLCRALMVDTHRLLRDRGYAGAILSPEHEGLARMYEKMGYAHCSGISEFSCEAAGPTVTLRRLGSDHYNTRRNEFLPDGGVRLGEAALAFLAAHAEFYEGRDFVLAVSRSEDGCLFCPELLGNTSAAPRILAALGCHRGTFRIPGNGRSFTMFLPLTDHAAPPTHMGFVFD